MILFLLETHLNNLSANLIKIEFSEVKYGRLSDFLFNLQLRRQNAQNEGNLDLKNCILISFFNSVNDHSNISYQTKSHVINKQKHLNDEKTKDIHFLNPILLIIVRKSQIKLISNFFTSENKLKFFFLFLSPT